MKKSYHTQAREEIARLFAQNAGKSLTAEEVCALLPEGAAGHSTVYRLLSEMCAQGSLIKTLREDTGKAEYLFCDRREEEHMHLRCAQCGRVVHVQHEAARILQGELLSRYGMRLDSARTVLVGECVDCCREEKA